MVIFHLKFVVKMLWTKFIVLATIFFNWLFIFIFIFLNVRLKVVSPIKTSNDLPLKIYYENIMDVTLLKNKIIKYQTRTHHS